MPGQEITLDQLGVGIDESAKRIAEIHREMHEESLLQEEYTRKGRDSMERRATLRRELEKLNELTEGRRLVTGIQAMHDTTQQAKRAVEESRAAVEEEKRLIKTKSSKLDEEIIAVAALREELEARMKTIDQLAQYKPVLEDLANVKANLDKG